MQRKVCVISVLLAVSLLGGCGNEGPDSDATSTASAPSAAQTSALRLCEEETSAFIGELDRLRGQIIGDLGYARYVSALRRVRDRYRRVDVSKLDEECLTGPAKTAETSLNLYFAAANAWTECLASHCNLAARMPTIEKKWWAAGLLLTKLHRALPGLEPGYSKGLPPVQD